MPHQRVVVIGGGIVGASAAFHLADAGVETVLIDAARAGRATSAGAGIIAPGTSMRPLPAFYDLAKPAVTYYPTLIERLADLNAGDTGYHVPGSLFLAEGDAELAQLDTAETVFRERSAAGMPNMGAIERIDNAAAQQHFPALRDVAGALYVPGAARVDGAKLRDAMISAASTRGARVVSGDAVVAVDGNRVVGVDIDGERLDADEVIVAAGCWSNAVLAATGIELPLAPQKGQIVHIDLPDHDTTDWSIVTWFGDQYMLTFGPNRVVCGATREFNSGYDLRVTPAGVKHVLDTALRVAPGLAHGTLADVRVGLRPYSDDGLPLLGRYAHRESLVIATGHGPSGLQLGPWSGHVAAEIALGRAVEVDLSGVAPDRVIDVAST